MKQILIWLVVAAVIAMGWMLYRSRSDSSLNVTPDAEREIENAKHR